MSESFSEPAGPVVPESASAGRGPGRWLRWPWGRGRAGAGARAACRAEADGGNAPAGGGGAEAPGSALPWDAVAPSRGQRLMRAAMAAGIAFFAVIGAVRTFAPRAAQVAPEVELPQSWGVDRAAAASVAEWTAREFLSLTGRDERQSGLAQTWANPADGWSGQGALEVTGSYVARTTPLDGGRVDVLVAVRVAADPKASAPVDGWVGVLVPVGVTGQRASVAGEPAIVGLPAAEQTDRPERVDVDQALTSETLDGAKAFVAAWAAGDARAVAAPGADIPAPALRGASAVLDEWRVAQGEGDARTAQAAITWRIGASSIQCHYTLGLTRVASGASQRWQISSITTTKKD